jgi:hypothetical protein
MTAYILDTIYPRSRKKEFHPIITRMSLPFGIEG